MVFDHQAEPDDGASLELNFAVSPERMRRLRRHPLVAAAQASRRALASTYFDTPDLSLHRRAMTLAISKEGRHYLQTLTDHHGRAGGAPSRSQWQTPVPKAAPDLDRLAAPELLADVDARHLAPVFVSRIRRSTRMIHPDPATAVEVSCEEGRIETAAGTMLPVCEMALELKTGEPQALFELARALNQAVPLRIETRSKAARGYGVLAGDGQDWRIEHGRGQLALRPELPAEDALAAILRRELWQMLAHDQAALGGEAEGVHQMRVALRRLRAIFSLFKTMIPGEQREWAMGEMKWISASLGEARNWDVFVEYLEPLAERFPAADDGIVALTQAALDGRRDAYAVVHETLTAQRYTDFALRLMAWTESRGWRQQSVSESSVNLLAPVGDLAAELLERRHRKARKLAKHFDELPPEGRHKLRIAVKKLRYAVDSLQQLYASKAVKRYLKGLGALQDDLGVMNDIAGMSGSLEKLQASAGDGEAMRRGAALMQGWYGKLMAERERKLVKKLRRFRATKLFWRVAES